MRNSYPLLKEYVGRIPTGIAVQDGNYEHTNPNTGKAVTLSNWFRSEPITSRSNTCSGARRSRTTASN